MGMAARVVFVTTSYPRFPGDPSGHFVETEALSRAARGDTVTVLAPGKAGAPYQGPVAVEWLGGERAFGWPGALARLRQDPSRVLAATAFVARARAALGRHAGAEQVVAHWLVPSAWPVALAHPGAIEVVAHGSDVRLLERLPHGFVRRVIDGLLARGARFRFVSHELRSRLARMTHSELLERSYVEPSPIAVTGVPSRTEARARLGVPEDLRVAVIVGRVVTSKRPVEAVHLALSHGAERVVVVGGAGDRELSNELRALGPNVTCPGFLPRDETLVWIAAANVLVNASSEEGASTVIREARALGTEVLTVPNGDVVEWAAQDRGITLVRAGSGSGG
jgi:glycosyltransferase involved in cell wall biosynthesis